MVYFGIRLQCTVCFRCTGGREAMEKELRDFSSNFKVNF